MYWRRAGGMLTSRQPRLVALGRVQGEGQVQTVASTAGVPRAEAFDYYREATRNATTKYEAKPFDRAGYYSEMQIGTVVDLTIGIWRCSPQ